MSRFNSKDYSEEQLLAQMNEDVEMGIALIMEQYAGLIWSVCNKYLHNQEDIKECVNEVFAEFALNYEKFRKEKGNLRNYLCSIAQRRAIDKYRKIQREQQKETLLAEKIAMEKKYDDHRRKAELLDDALDQLAPIDSQILRMKYYDGLTYKEISEKLNMDYNLVKKRSQRSYKKLLKIILLGLLLALLAACTAILLRQYRVSEQSGFIWAVDTAAYGLEDEEMTVESGNVLYKVTDAVYYNSSIEIEITAQWLGMMEGEWKKEFDRQADEVIQGNWQEELLQGIKTKIYVPYLKTEDRMLNTTYMKHSNDSDDGSTIKYTLQYDWTASPDEKDEISVTLVCENDVEFELKLLPLPIHEYKYKEEIKVLDGSSFFFGPHYIGEENIIISFYYMNVEEYELSPLITNNYRGMGSWTQKQESIYLIDTQGNKTKVQRIGSEDADSAGIRRDFQLYFPKVESGEYELSIPYLCFVKEAVSEKITLQLPTGTSDYIECDYTVLFPDGAGYHITGITRQENLNIWESQNRDLTISQVEQKEWLYYITYDVISVDEMEFCHSVAQGETDMGTAVTSGIDENNRWYFKAVQEEMPNTLEIEFGNPVYVFDEQITMNITIADDAGSLK